MIVGVDAILFDIDGTLVNLTPVVERARRPEHARSAVRKAPCIVSQSSGFNTTLALARVLQLTVGRQCPY